MGLLSSIGGIAGSFFGGPVGGAIGGVIGSALDGGGSSGSGSPAGAADPFASQRGQYQGQLRSFMWTSPQYQDTLGQMATLAQGPQLNRGYLDQQEILAARGINPTNTAFMGQIASQQGTEAGRQLSAMTAPGATFSSSDPSYNFRFQQGQQAVERSALARGLGGSGNVLQALTDYGQGAASQEYGAQFARLSSLSQQQQSQQQQQFAQQGAMASLDLAGQAQGFNQAAALQQQQMAAQAAQFGQLGSVYTNGQNQYQNQYSRLAQLAGANIGSPSAAGQLMQQQQAGSAAYLQQQTPAILSQLKGWFGGSSASDASAISGSSWDFNGTSFPALA